MDKNSFFGELKKRMDGALVAFDNDLQGLRTGRASNKLIESVIVEAYGDKMHISQLGTVATQDSKTIMVQVWDKAVVKPVEKAISDANLGVTVSSDGQNIRVILPPLSQERRNDLVKIAHKFAENAKVAVRNIRRDGMDSLKKFEKDSEITKDEHHTMGEDIQKITDDYIKKIDDQTKAKEKEMTQV